MRHLYTLFLWLLLPFIGLKLWLRSRKQPAYLQHVGERFGFYQPRGTNQKQFIWLHAVSVGETRACQALIQQLQQCYPEYRILLSHSTPTGRETSFNLFGDQIERVYLPYDYPFAIKRFLRFYQPKIGVLMETEIWCNLIYYSRQYSIPLLLLNARMSAKSARSYAKFARLSQQAINGLSVIAAQTEADATRFQALGRTTISVMGNLKYDITPPNAMLQRGDQLRILLGNKRTVLLAASTREGEELLILKAFSQLKIPQLLLLIVPRHPQRFEEVATLIKQHGLRLQRRSQQQPIDADTQVVLGDSMGEMFAYYHAADLALIGGSLLPFGSQNLIEACAVGTPVLLGPHCYNFAQATESAVQAGAAVQLSNSQQLSFQLQNLLSNPQQLAQMSLACKQFVANNQGATTQAMDLIHHQLQALRSCTTSHLQAALPHSSTYNR